MSIFLNHRHWKGIARIHSNQRYIRPFPLNRIANQIDKSHVFVKRLHVLDRAIRKQTINGSNFSTYLLTCRLKQRRIPLLWIPFQTAKKEFSAPPKISRSTVLVSDSVRMGRSTSGKAQIVRIVVENATKEERM